MRSSGELAEKPLLPHYAKMAWVLRTVGFVGIACGLTACAAVSGLDGYTPGECLDGCDASVDVAVSLDGGREARADGTVDRAVPPGMDASEEPDAPEAGCGSACVPLDAGDAGPEAADGCGAQGCPISAATRYSCTAG